MYAWGKGCARGAGDLAHDDVNASRLAQHYFAFGLRLGGPAAVDGWLLSLVLLDQTSV